LTIFISYDILAFIRGSALEKYIMKIATANVCNYLVEAGIIFLIIFAPIYYGSVTLWTITVIELIILFMLLIWGVGIVAQGKLVFRRTSMDIPILAFCICSQIMWKLRKLYQVWKIRQTD